MARDHGPNSYENHIHVMTKHVDAYNFAFDDSYTEFIPYGSSEQLPANQLINQVNYETNEAICIGEFRFVKKEEKHPYVIATVNKTIKLFQSTEGYFKSQTKSYSYNIRLLNIRSEKIPTLRFDNKDCFGFNTKHHLHIQNEYKDVNKRKEEPFPAHIGSNFPHLSDIFLIGYSLATNAVDPINIFNMIRTEFIKIPKEYKCDPNRWVSLMPLDWFNFIL
jgi:hypothetical protein